VAELRGKGTAVHTLLDNRDTGSQRSDHGRRQLRVAIVINRIVGGGAERFVVDLASYLAGRGVSVVVCVTRSNVDLDVIQALHAASVEVLLLNRRNRLMLHRWWPLLELLGKGEVDILNTHLPGSNLNGIFLSLASGTPLIATEHGSVYERRPLLGPLYRLVEFRAKALVAVSEDIRNQLARVVPETKLRVIIPSSRESPLPTLSRAEALARLGVPDNCRVIGTVCALRKEKRLDVLFKAFEALAVRRHVRLIVVGDGPARTEVDNLAHRLNPEDVVLTGWRTDAAQLLPAFDVFVLTSRYEGTPLALIEAMRAGCAIVTTAVGGVPAVAPDGECALHVPAGDSVALASTIERVLDDAQAAANLRSRARQRARERYRFERAGEAWLALFQEVARTTRVEHGDIR